MRHQRPILASSLAMLVSGLFLMPSFAAAPVPLDFDKIPHPPSQVDPTLKPLQPAATLPSGQMLGSVTDAHGHQADFWVNQMVVLAPTDAEVAALAKRWNGTGTRRFLLQDRGVGQIPGVFVVTVDPAKARPDLLPQFVWTVHPLSRGVRRFSSVAAQFTAAAAQEAASGALVELNWLMANHDVRDRVAMEAPTVLDPDANAFHWPYLRAGGPQDFAVADAWRVLDYFAWLGHHVNVTIFDSGFTDNVDLPRALSLPLYGWSTYLVLGPARACRVRSMAQPLLPPGSRCRTTLWGSPGLAGLSHV